MLISHSSSSQASFVDEDCHDFLEWLERKAGEEISFVLSIGKSSCGRTLYTSKTIKKGDCLVKVPHSVQLSRDNLRPEFSELIKEEEVDNDALLAVVIMYEKKLGTNSEWAHYISLLPRPEDMHSTAFWCGDELEMIRPSWSYGESLMQKKSIEKDFLGVKLVFDKFPCLFQCGSLEEFTYAFELVVSRSRITSKGESLVPFMDFLNHDDTSGACVCIDDHKLFVNADRDYDEGEEVGISYGKYSNATLLLSFGFTLPNNPHDFFHIGLDIPQGDKLYTQKWGILQNLSIEEDDEFPSTWKSFKVGQGNIIPSSLRIFARVLVCNSQQELNGLREKATQSNALKNKENEIAAHQLLHFKISRLIEKHNEYIKLLLQTDSVISRKSVVRRQSAKNLLQGELRVMESARDWLQKYCFTLSEN